MGRSHRLKTTGLFLNLEPQREIPVAELRSAQTNNFFFIQILEKTEASAQNAAAITRCSETLTQVNGPKRALKD
jgi:hypothetical protein